MKLSSIALFAVIAIASSSSRSVVNAKLRSSRKHVQRNTKARVPIQSRIIGGTEAAQGEFPYFVLWDGCGASLIHEDILISAGHSPSTLPSNTTFTSNATLPSNSTLSLNATLSTNATSAPTPLFEGNSTYAPTATPSLSASVNSTSFPTATLAPAPSFGSRNTYSPTVSFGPTPSISSGSDTYAPTSSTFIRFTFGPTASSAPASATFPPTATPSPFSSGGTPSPTPAPFDQSGGGSFSLTSLRVACETFLCPYNHANVQYCHTESNGRQKAYCVSSDIAFVFLADNDRDYCGPCIEA